MTITADIDLDKGTVTLPLSALSGLALTVLLPAIPAREVLVPGVARTYTYEVPSFTSPYDVEPYLVLAHVMSDGRVLWSCTCKDWQFRGNVRDPLYTCKHISVARFRHWQLGRTR